MGHNPDAKFMWFVHGLKNHWITTQQLDCCRAKWYLQEIGKREKSEIKAVVMRWRYSEASVSCKVTTQEDEYHHPLLINTQEMRRRSKFPPLLPPLVLSLYLPILPLSLSYYWSLPSLSEFMILEACLSSGRCLAGTGTPPADPLQSSLILASFSLLVAFIFVNFFASPSFTRYYYSIKEVSITRYEEVFRF